MTSTPTPGSLSSSSWLDAVAWNADGLVPAVAQEVGSGDVLMLAWMNREALAATLERGQAVYWSRSRGRLWHKGEESGHFQRVRDIWLDCDGDTLVLQVEQVARIACHTGSHSCFFRRLERGHVPDAPPRWAGEPAPAYHTLDTQSEAVLALAGTLTRLSRRVAERMGGDTERSYVARLLAKGEDAVLKKIGEEATELVMAAKDKARERVVAECADLWFHSLIALAQHGLLADDVLRELQRREGLSGLDEKALRKVRAREQEEDAG